jgi:hypothetical protein
LGGVGADSGTCTDSGNGDVGRGFCDASVPAPKLARVGVVASSRGFEDCGVGAVVGRGVIGDGSVISRPASPAGSGLFTGRKAVVMVEVVRARSSRGGVEPGVRGE